MDVLKKAGIPLGGTPILSKEWTNHNGVVSDQVGTSEHSARSQLQGSKAARAAQHSKRQLANAPASTKVTWSNLDAIAIGSSSNEGDNDKEDDDNEGDGKYGCDNLDKAEDNNYPPLAKTTTQSSS
ncbi:hypothetical protein BY996DRAFT_6498749 [Phakopsora pachyrhizi]|nr:hypothetical protein BY996DRAFT_6498749 [Phakopsora pachyrhizi]